MIYALGAVETVKSKTAIVAATSRTPVLCIIAVVALCELQGSRLLPPSIIMRLSDSPRSLCGDATDPVVVCQAAAPYNVVACNDAWVQLCGWSCSEMIGEAATL